MITMNSNRHFNPQNAIIDRMENAGYDVNNDGICAGATITAIESALKDGHLTHYDALIQYLNDTPDLISEVNSLKIKRAQLAVNKTKCDLSSKELFMLDASALIDRIQLYQSPDQYHGLFTKSISQHESQLITPLVSTHHIHGIQSQPQWTWSNIYDAEQLEDLLRAIQTQFTNQHPIAFAIANSGHKIALIHTNNQWILADINNAPSRTYQHDQLDKLTRKLQHIFRDKYSSKCTLSFNVFSTNAHVDATYNLLSPLLRSPLCEFNYTSIHQHDELANLAQISIINHQTQLLEQLLNTGLDANTTVNGHSLAYLAASYGYTDMLSMLINKGANVDRATSENVTPLFIATQRQHVDAVSLLLTSHADANITRNDGVTPLAMAINKNNRALVCMLTKHGADLTAQTPYGTPLEIATALGNDQIQHLLKLLIVSKMKAATNLRHQPSLFSKTKHKPAQTAAHQCKSGVKCYPTA